MQIEEETALSDALSERYLAYALSTITARSLPDARDGLKPVHRRLLFAMRALKLDPQQGFKKCARIVGDVMGKFHPHGDQAIYDAMVRLAQDFAVRYPLVEGQGNFGNIDGDNPAAMRYTEARMTQISSLMMQGLDEDMVDFRATYDGEAEEPIVMPAAFPNLLANGASGIAVGMATNIPPHNILEICDAALHIIKNPNCSVKTLMNYIKGPDFPTGGELIETPESLLVSYEQGKGSFRVRASYQVEKLKGGGYEIIVSEIPYQIAKSRLIERLAELALGKENPLLDDIRDESTEDLRIILKPKSRQVAPELLMESLYRQSDLEAKFSLNMNMLVENGTTPRQLNLKQAIEEWLFHRHDVLLRKLRFRSDTINKRLHLLDGYIICHLNLDEVIRIIREEDEPKPALIKQFQLSDLQAEAILNMRLRSLRKLEEMALLKEKKGLEQELKEIKSLQNNEEARWQSIAQDIKALKADMQKNKVLSARRTKIAKSMPDIEFNPDDLIEKEPMTIILSQKGWIRAQKSHLDEKARGQLKFKDGDREKFILHCQSTDKILLFASNGRAYSLNVDKIPLVRGGGNKGAGEPIRLMVELENDHDIIHVKTYHEDDKMLIASSDGYGFIIKDKDASAQTRNGKQIMSFNESQEMAVCTHVIGDSIAVIGENRKLLLFALDELPEMARGRGVRLQKYRDGGISDVKCFERADGLSWRIGVRERVERNLDLYYGKRAQSGRLPPAGFPRTNKFC